MLRSRFLNVNPRDLGRGLHVWGRAVLALWALWAGPAGSACPRHRPIGAEFPLTSRDRLGIRTSLVSEMCVRRTSRDPGGNSLRKGRSLEVLLHGSVIQVGNYSCQDECKPAHEEEATLPGREHQDSCTHSTQLQDLQIQDDIDLKCLGSNITCDDLENNATLKNWKDVLYKNCNQDEDLLHGDCELVCRTKVHPTKRCTYTFDRNNKYGMHGKSGMYGFHHCVLLKVCEVNATVEDNILYCNITDTHELLFSRTVTTTFGPTTRRESTTTTTATQQVMIVNAPAPAAEEGGSVVVGALIGGGAVGLMAVMATTAYFKVCRKLTSPPPNAPTGIAYEPDEGSTVVVGRPVAGAACGETANPGGDETKGGFEKGDKVVP